MNETASPLENKQDEPGLKKKEVKALGFIIIVLFPLLSVAVVGSYGLIIWMMQAFGGIAGH